MIKNDKIRAFLNDPNLLSKYSLDLLELKSSRILREISGVVPNDLYVYSCGLDSWSSPERKTSSGKSIFHSLHYVVKGEGIFECDGKENKIGKGTMFVIFADGETRYYPVQSNPWTYVYLDIGGILQSSVLKQLGFDIDHCVREFKKPNAVEKIFYEVYENALEAGPRSFKTLASLYGLFSELDKFNEGGAVYGRRESHIRRAVGVIKDNLAMATVELVAKECMVSSAYLTRICKKIRQAFACRIFLWK